MANHGKKYAEARKLVDSIHVSDSVYEYITDLIAMTRDNEDIQLSLQEVTDSCKYLSEERHLALILEHVDKYRHDKRKEEDNYDNTEGKKDDRVDHCASDRVFKFVFLCVVIRHTSHDDIQRTAALARADHRNKELREWTRVHLESWRERFTFLYILVDILPYCSRLFVLLLLGKDIDGFYKRQTRSKHSTELSATEV